MNIPKLVSIIIVLLCAVFLLYPTFDSAIPKELNGSPFTVEMEEGGLQVNVDDNMNISVTMPRLTLGSKLPEDLKDVTVDVYMGSSDKRVNAGTFDFGTVPANGTIQKVFKSNDLNGMFFLSYLPSLMTSDGKLDIPIYLAINFKYMEWQGEELLDLGITVKVKGTESNGTVTNPIVIGDDSVVTVTPGDGIVKTIAQKIYNEYGDTLVIEVGDGTTDMGQVDVIISSSGEMAVTMSGATIGSEHMNLYRILQKMFDENGGKLTFTWDYHTYTVEGDQAKAILNAVKAFYPEGE